VINRLLLLNALIVVEFNFRTLHARLVIKMETLEGTLERIVYENEETGYTIARFSSRDYPNEVLTVVGDLMSANPGECLLLKGQWVINPKYGRQFKIVDYETIMPATLVGIKKYLGSGLIKGIGPVMAGRIVNHFGLDTIDIIERSPRKLEQVPGIGRKRVEMVMNAWEEQQEIKNVMLFLQSHNVSTTYAVKIYKTYEQESIRVVREEPYRLADDIYGIGFKTADTIAQNLGIDKNDPARIMSGIQYVLNQRADDGHVYLPTRELIGQSGEILEVTEGQVKEGIDGLLEKKAIVAEKEGGGLLSPGLFERKKRTGLVQPFEQFVAEDEGEEYVTPEAKFGDFGVPAPTGESVFFDEAEVLEENEAGNAAVFLVPFFYAEVGVANGISRLLNTPGSAQVHHYVEESIDELEVQMGMRFAQKQREAIKTTLTNKVMILTGGPGTGKTTTTLGIIRLLEQLGKRVLLAAPTGRAAKRLSETTGREAKTIHRLLEYSPKGNTFKRNQDNPLEAAVVIIDEISMVDLLLMNNLIKAVPKTASLILVGDVDQLPAVGAGNVLKDLIASGCVEVVRLTEVFRQARKSMIITNAHIVNQGRMPLLTGPKDRDFFFIEEEEPEKVAELVQDLICERLPSYYGYHPIDDIQLICPMRRGTVGVLNFNRLLQDALNKDSQNLPKGARSFRIGDKVMQTRNNYDYDVFNGDIGRITKVDTTAQKVTVMFPEKVVNYEYAALDELTLAYAITVHKSQGSEYKAVVMPLLTQHYMMLQRNLLYTGITRAKELVVIVGTKRALGMAVRNNKVVRRYTGLAERLNRTCGDEPDFEQT